MERPDGVRVASYAASASLPRWLVDSELGYGDELVGDSNEEAFGASRVADFSAPGSFRRADVCAQCARSGFPTCIHR